MSKGNSNKQTVEEMIGEKEALLEPVVEHYRKYKQLSDEGVISSLIYNLSQIAFFEQHLQKQPEGTKKDRFIQDSMHYFRYHSYKKGEAVFHYGDDGDNFYIVLQGQVGVYVPRDQEHIQADLKYHSEHHGLHHRHGSHQKQLSAAEHLLYNTFTQEQKHYYMLWSHKKDIHQIFWESLLYKKYDSYFLDQKPICKFQKVFQFHAGQHFGDVALTTDQPRTASIVAATDQLHCLSMNKHDYRV